MLGRLGAPPPDDFDSLYIASAQEANRWWRDEHRGYSTAERIHWLLAQLVDHAPGRLRGGALGLRERSTAPSPTIRRSSSRARARCSRASPRASRWRSSPTPASPAARPRIACWSRTTSDATSWRRSTRWTSATPSPARRSFRAALDALGVAPHEALHVGDIERTDVAGALGVGMRAVRLDAVRDSGPTAAEYVAPSLEALSTYLLGAA